MKLHTTIPFFRSVCFLSAIVLLPGLVLAQGIALNGVGPINRSMGGTATAAPIDAAGALHWNPASISGLPSSELGFGLELLLPSEELSSQVTAGAFGDGIPAADWGGATRGEPGVSPIPSVAWVHKRKNSPWTYGLGMFGVAGFRTNYPGSAANPIVAPQAMGGLGHINSEAEYLQIVPTISYAISPNLSFGVAPTISLAKVTVDPLVIAPPAGGEYTSGSGTRRHWGGGVQLGLYYEGDNDWNFGASIKSPQWFEDFRFRTDDGVGGSRTVTYDLDYPMIVSLGAAYTGIERFLFACDVRYFDYKNTDGFGDPAACNADGSLVGLGWGNVFAFSAGAQYSPNCCRSWRIGYSYRQSPYSDDETFFNVATPLGIQHVVSIGVSQKISKNIVLSGTYLHGFEYESTGPFHAPGIGRLAGTSVTNQVSADAVAFGVKLLY